MSDISGSGSLQFWQGIAAVVGASLGGFFLAIGRKSGGAASRVAEATTSGDALQREILAELRRSAEATAALAEETRGLRTDWQAKRDADDLRRREQRDRSVDDQLDDLRHGQSISRRGQNEMKVLLREMIERLPTQTHFDRRAHLAAVDPNPVADEADPA